MSYELSDYCGDEIYCINCTGDAVVGDEVCFDRATFTGSYRRPRFGGFERIKAKITNDSYGAKKQQHTFTMQLEDGEKLLIKGRNLYRQGVYRKPWPSEGERLRALDEKHIRGDDAREQRRVRKSCDDNFLLFGW